MENSCRLKKAPLIYYDNLDYSSLNKLGYYKSIIYVLNKLIIFVILLIPISITIVIIRFKLRKNILYIYIILLK